jgi:hypothetical protein
MKADHDWKVASWMRGVEGQGNKLGEVLQERVKIPGFGKNM